MKSETPLIDLSPKLYMAVKRSQDALAKWIVPDSGVPDKEVLNELIEILDNRELVVAMREVFEEKVSTGLHDKNGNEIFDGDDLVLNYESIVLKGKAKFLDGEWQIFKDSGNHVSITYNDGRISKS